MEQPEYLIDSNAIIDYLGNRISAVGMTFMDSIIDRIPRISVISKIEVLGFNTTDEYYQILISFMNDADVVGLSEHIIEESITIRKKHRIKLPDAIIAATAVVNNLTLISRNISDFRDITHLQVVDPHNF